VSFTIAARPRQHSHSRVRVPRDSRSYFTVSDARLPFSSPPTASRATVEVFHPASTRDELLRWLNCLSVSNSRIKSTQSQSYIAIDRIEITTTNSSSVSACLSVVTDTCFSKTFSSSGLFRLSGVISHSSRIRILASRCLVMDCSGFQASWHNIHTVFLIIHDGLYTVTSMYHVRQPCLISVVTKVTLTN
jgi:hypothetical protein